MNKLREMLSLSLTNVNAFMAEYWKEAMFLQYFASASRRYLASNSRQTEAFFLCSVELAWISGVIQLYS